MENSAIDWLRRGDVHGATWNPWISCSHATYVGPDGKEHVHPGCINCYAEDLMDDRYHKCIWGSAGNRVKTSDHYWRKPLTWNRKAEKAGVRMPVFPSLCDPFEQWDGPMIQGQDTDGTTMRLYRFEGGYRRHRSTAIIGGEPATMDDLRRDMFRLIDETPWLEWILFTKRPQNVRRMWPMVREAILPDIDPGEWYRPNVTLCYSPANQDTLEYGAPLILQCADLCPTVGVSVEPMLGRVDLTMLCRGSYEWRDVLNGIHRTHCSQQRCEIFGWVIIGVESDGPRVGRLGDFKSEADWWDGAAAVVQQCRAAGVPCYLKQGPRDGRVVHNPVLFDARCIVREFPQLEIANA